MLPSVRIKLYAFRENISPHLHNTYDFITIKVICHVFFVKIFKNEINKNKSIIRQVTTANEILENQKNGCISALLTLEEGEVCEGDEKKLEEFYREYDS